MENDALLVVNGRESAIDIIVPKDAEGNVKSRLLLFAKWLDENKANWYTPRLGAYRDYLLHDRQLEPSSVLAHLSSVRSRYTDLLLDRDLFYSLTNPNMGLLEQKAFVDELVARIQNAINPKSAKVKTKTVQDVSDFEHIRLSEVQADALLRSPGVDTLAGLRDTAMIAIMLCTGVREAELAAIRIEDLNQRIGGELALIIREGKGMKQRLIPYGELSWCLSFVNAWIRRANIEEGFVFRRILKDGKTIGKNALTTRAVQKRLGMYGIWAETREVRVQPHDLRRTYARRLFDVGVDPLRIMQNLGHANLKTTLGYIGDLEASKRRPPAAYKVPMDLLREIS